MTKITFLLITVFITNLVQAKSVVLKPSQAPVNFLELYTSQGCNSCPPAERWLSQFVSSKKLWTDIIPVNFHVDYWDYLGWHDPFAKRIFSYRQRTYNRLGLTHNIATPGFVLNGRGWDGWFRRQQVPPPSSFFSIPLEVIFDAEQQTFAVRSERNRGLTAHIAILGFGIETKVSRGENRGKTLTHDFVVIGYDNFKLDKTKGTHANFPQTIEVETKKRAFVVWLSEENNIAPVQVVATWL